MSSMCNKEQDDSYYTSVTFIKSQEDPLYSNIRPTEQELARENKNQEDDSVEYSVINVKSSTLLWVDTCFIWLNKTFQLKYFLIL